MNSLRRTLPVCHGTVHGRHENIRHFLPRGFNTDSHRHTFSYLASVFLIEINSRRAPKDQFRKVESYTKNSTAKGRFSTAVFMSSTTIHRETQNGGFDESRAVEESDRRADDVISGRRYLNILSMRSVSGEVYCSSSTLWQKLALSADFE